MYTLGLLLICKKYQFCVRFVMVYRILLLFPVDFFLNFSCRQSCHLQNKTKQKKKKGKERGYMTLFLYFFISSFTIFTLYFFLFSYYFLGCIRYYVQFSLCGILLGFYTNTLLYIFLFFSYYFLFFWVLGDFLGFIFSFSDLGSCSL